MNELAIMPVTGSACLEGSGATAREATWDGGPARASAAGETEATNAVERLYAEHGRAALQLARRMTSSHAAEDAVQEAFLRILRYGRVEARVIDRAYVLASVRNAVRSVARRGRTRACSLEDVPDPEIERGAHETGIDLAGVLRELTEPMATALELTIVRGLSMRRAAAASGVDVRTFVRRRRGALLACATPLRLVRNQ